MAMLLACVTNYIFIIFLYVSFIIQPVVFPLLLYTQSQLWGWLQNKKESTETNNEIV